MEVFNPLGHSAGSIEHIKTPHWWKCFSKTTSWQRFQECKSIIMDRVLCSVWVIRYAVFSVSRQHPRPMLFICALYLASSPHWHHELVGSTMHPCWRNCILIVEMFYLMQLQGVRRAYIWQCVQWMLHFETHPANHGLRTQRICYSLYNNLNSSQVLVYDRGHCRVQHSIPLALTQRETTTSWGSSPSSPE